MENMVSKTFVKVLCLGASIMLTLFAGLFAMSCLTCAVVSIVTMDLISFILAAFCGFVAWMIWSVRKDTLV